jgi:hypothetical protein
VNIVALAEIAGFLPHEDAVDEDAVDDAPRGDRTVVVQPLARQVVAERALAAERESPVATAQPAEGGFFHALDAAADAPGHIGE